MSIAVRGLSRWFGAVSALDDVSFEVPRGSLVGLLGPSGSGKSTALRIIAGLEPADSGTIELHGEDVSNLSIQARGVGFVFQHYALFRHMTIRKNIAFGLEVRRFPQRQIRARVDELLGLVRLEEYGDRYPTQLSGGQRQRVALARALAPQPKVLLLDEPFGALDARVRDELRSWLRALHDQVPLTTLLVTHDQQEAFEVCDEVVVLNRGRVEQAGPPQTLYENPASPFVAEFLGSVNVLRGQARRGTAVLSDGLRLRTKVEGLDGPIAVYVRPHDLELARHDDGDSSWPATVIRVIPMGARERFEIRLPDGTILEVELTRDVALELDLAPGDSVYVKLRSSNVFHEHSDAFAASGL